MRDTAQTKQMSEICLEPLSATVSSNHRRPLRYLASCRFHFLLNIAKLAMLIVVVSLDLTPRRQHYVPRSFTHSATLQY